MKYLFAALLILHGMLHLPGFSNACYLGAPLAPDAIVNHATQVPWLLVFLLFAISAVCYLRGIYLWMALAVTAIVTSQILIFFFWRGAAYGTMVNLGLLLVTGINFALWHFESGYKSDVKRRLGAEKAPAAMVTGADVAHLPPLVRKYLHAAGAVNKPRPASMFLAFRGEMRERGKAWFSFTAEQYNFFEPPGRHFFIKATIKGLPVYGYHCYGPDGASMDIRLLGLWPVGRGSGKMLFQTETVTFFNDLCMFAPGAMPDRRIRWETLDESTVKATYTNGNTTISAELAFDDEGKLVNFSSNDRYEMSLMKTLRYTTPLSRYQDFGGYFLPGYGEATWHYPEGPFVYGKFILKNIVYHTGNE